MNFNRDKLIKSLKPLLENNDKRRRLLVVLGAIGVLLILLSEIKLPVNKVKDSATVSFSGNYSEYVKGLENELSEIISSINGVGTCKVMITLKNTNEKFYAQNIENSYSDSSNSKNNEYVIYESENGDSPILLKENFPAIEGVAVVCSGGDNNAVRENIINCVCALFNLPANRVSVSKLTDKG